MNDYFILKSGEDGTRIEGPFAWEQVQSRITPDKCGDTYYGDKLEFLSAIPQQDKGCWMARERSILIIKGQIVVPRAAKVVTEYVAP